MKRLRNHLIGVEQGSRILFSDFADGGPMWSGDGPREVRLRLSFSEPFRTPPMVHVSLSMWDTDGATNQRLDLKAEAVSETGFELVFRTWGDSRLARARGDWMAIGEVRDGDEWELY